MFKPFFKITPEQKTLLRYYPIESTTLFFPSIVLLINHLIFCFYDEGYTCSLIILKNSKLFKKFDKLLIEGNISQYPHCDSEAQVLRETRSV